MPPPVEFSKEEAKIIATASEVSEFLSTPGGRKVMNLLLDLEVLYLNSIVNGTITEQESVWKSIGSCDALRKIGDQILGIMEHARELRLRYARMREAPEPSSEVDYVESAVNAVQS